jgi:hypothetical protein
MDAELILLFKNCAVRSHFCVSTRSAILSVDRLKRTVRSGPSQNARKEDLRSRRVTGCPAELSLHRSVGLKETAEEFGTGQDRQGLKPDIFSIVYGPTKVVP